MLDTRFPRLRGDIGCAETFDFPVRYVVVKGALPRRAVVGRDRSLLQPFIAAAQALEADGCSAIATSCGFLALFQHEMQRVVGVPVWTSSLLLVAELEATLPAEQRVGIVTADAASLTEDHLAAVGARADAPIEGLAPDSAFHRTLLDNRIALDAAEAQAATVAAAKRLVAKHPNLGAIVLECTNMPPYADAVRAASRLPVHDITTLIAARLAALHP